ncbi:MAG: winged helix-turn-helix transcriptional regulator [Nitrospirae bacterium]|nr:winged helix-turn-helix transcriptional regulator [Nitrospirota bacterium]
MLTEQQCAGVLRAMGDETRLRILESLLVQEKCVSDLVKEIQRGQPHVSHHLRILRAAGLVEGLREGKRICYRVSPTIQRALKHGRRPVLDFGCCQISFAEAMLSAQSR